jgi:uncharacterized protein (UPF0264 family)
MNLSDSSFILHPSSFWKGLSMGRPSLLVSVRCAAEARVAAAAGAALIDVKEPANGPLGRPAEATIREVVGAIGTSCPVSAALGELAERNTVPAVPGLSYAKWGLAGWSSHPGWRRILAEAGHRLRNTIPGCRPVAAAYADSERARAPEPFEVLDFVRRHRWETLLLDTWGKDGSTLLEWRPVSWVVRFRRRCREARIRVALAGALGLPEIRALGAAAPDWFAVRGAVCRRGDRASGLAGAAVRKLVRFLAAPVMAQRENSQPG